VQLKDLRNKENVASLDALIHYDKFCQNVFTLSVIEMS